MERFSARNLLAVAVVALTGCSTKPIAEVRIGFGGPLTGKQAAYGSMVYRGANLRVDEENSRHPGNKFSLVRGDDQATPSQAVIVAQDFVAQNLPIVLGHFNSSCSLAAQKTYDGARIPNISYGSTNDDVGRGSSWTFRTPYKNSLQGVTLARYAATHGLKRVAILAENEDYGKGMSDVFKSSAAELGVQIVAEKAYDSETSDFRPLFIALRTAGPDAILLAGFYPQLQVAAVQAREVGVRAVFLAGDGVGSSTDFIKNAGSSAEGTVATGPFLIESERPAIRDFRNRFKAKYGEDPNSWAVYAYDAAGLAVDAILKVGSDRERIRQHLASYSSRATAFPGLVAPIWFDEHGDAVNEDVSLAVVKNGKYEVLSVR